MSFAILMHLLLYCLNQSSEIGLSQAGLKLDFKIKFNHNVFLTPLYFTDVEVSQLLYLWFITPIEITRHYEIVHRVLFGFKHDPY